MKCFLSSVVLCSFLLWMLPGCGGKVVDWASEHFEQGCVVSQALNSARSYIRTTRVYDQFTLVGGFHILWLSNPVRQEFTRLNGYMRGKNAAEEQAFLRRQIAENDHFTTFYVLSNNNISLTDGNAFWSPFLKIGNAFYAPLEIKEVELPQEYALIFGKYYNKFKTVYAIKFSALDVDGNPIITPKASSLVLEFRGLEKKTCVQWVLCERDRPQR